jgi:hypothetical protein
MTGKINTIKDINITENGVHKLLKNLNPNKAAGRLSFVWSLSGGETILSMYFQYAFLISLCVCRFKVL